MADLVREAGFEDISFAQCMVFRFEGPEGRRPSELAARLKMSKQAVNDCLRILEDRGYLARAVAPGDGRARVVRLTARGEALQKAIYAAGRRVEQEWQEAIGEPDWSAFTRVLDRLAGAALDAVPGTDDRT